MHGSIDRSRACRLPLTRSSLLGRVLSRPQLVYVCCCCCPFLPCHPHITSVARAAASRSSSPARRPISSAARSHRSRVSFLGDRSLTQQRAPVHHFRNTLVGWLVVCTCCHGGRWCRYKLQQLRCGNCAVVVQLEAMVKEASVDDVMKVLMASRKFEMQELWATCSHLVARSGLSADLLSKHLPIDVVAKIEEIRAKSPAAASAPPRSPFLTHHYLPISAPAPSSAADRDHKIRRMRRALDAADIELVKLMVMGEGLDLDDALAVHYAVQNCSRDVVKALLELGAADVNSRAGPAGKTSLHLAAEMVSPDMVSVLLDHHADPNARTLDGVTPLDVLRGLTSEFLFKGAVPGLTHIEPNKLRLCLELVQSAVMVTARDEGGGAGADGAVGGGSSDGGNFPRSDADDSLVSLTMNSTLMYQGQEMAAAVAGEPRKGNGGGRGSPSNLYFPNGFP
ncbi:hypothetical protein BS78_05G039000 [Paspalum vaginatum]|nr:hypothetical protein BS78_05G039000 [Paspalum vaginatum]